MNFTAGLLIYFFSPFIISRLPVIRLNFLSISTLTLSSNMCGVNFFKIWIAYSLFYFFAFAAVHIISGISVTLIYRQPFKHLSFVWVSIIKVLTNEFLILRSDPINPNSSHHHGFAFHWHFDCLTITSLYLSIASCIC